MKKIVLLAALSLAVMAPAVAWSQNGPGGNGGPPPQGAGPQGGSPDGEGGQNFQQRKAELIKRISDRLACVQAASTPEAMRACMPGRPGGPGGEGPGGQGGQQGGQGGAR